MHAEAPARPMQVLADVAPSSMEAHLRWCGHVHTSNTNRSARCLGLNFAMPSITCWETCMGKWISVMTSIMSLATSLAVLMCCDDFKKYSSKMVPRNLAVKVSKSSGSNAVGTLLAKVCSVS